MIKRTILFTAALMLTIGLGIAIGTTADSLKQPSDLTVHEWGTFTTVADAEGKSAQWLPLSGRADLPCFVNVFQGVSAKVRVSELPSGPALTYATAKTQLLGSVRMETPVLYFYSPRTQRADVKVDFPHGYITEWYPNAVVNQSVVRRNSLQQPTNASIVWKGVDILPSEWKTALPDGGDKSHYYAARPTDANVIHLNGQTEKFLFYRGVGDFPVPLNVTVNNDGKIRLKHLTGKPSVILFQNNGGKLGYRTVDTGKNEALVDPPALTADFESLREELQRTLVGQGLYEKEAQAMIETWRDSWFEEGTRVIYIVPSKMVEEILPLTITPKPRSVKRVFVGRAEVLTPEMIQTVAKAVKANDTKTLQTYGRFLSPILDRIPDAKPSADFLNSALANYVNGSSSCHK